MSMATHRLLAALLLFGGLSMLSPVRAGETFNTCTGFIDSVPATITTQGVWCLRRHLSTNITSGNAITIAIATNNVTIDCNDFRIGGLAAGNGSWAVGIHANNRQNATVRRCNVRGFNFGIQLSGGAGHLVEDNRLDNNLFVGIDVFGDNNLVQRNRVYDTGGWTGHNVAYGINAQADIVGNTVSGLFVDTAEGALIAIRAVGSGRQIRDNTVSGFDMTPAQGGAVNFAYGISAATLRQRASGNQVVGSPGGSNISGQGINAFSPVYCLDNTVGGFTTNIHANCNGTGNVTL